MPNADHDIAQVVAGHSAQLRGLEDAVSGIERAIQRLAEQFTASQRPNWSAWVGGGGLVLTVLTLVGSIGNIKFAAQDREIDEARARLGAMEGRALEDAYHRGKSDEAMAAVRLDVAGHRVWIKEVSDRSIAAVAALDEALQREMRDLDRIGEARDVAVDKRIQEEITRNASERHEQLDAMRALVNELTTLSRDASGLHADHAARIKALEERKGP